MIERNFVTPETLAAIDDVNRKCHALHVPAPPVVFVTTEVFNADGTPVLHQYEQSRSWNRNFYNFYASMFLPCSVAVDGGSVGYGSGSTKLKDISGNVIIGTSGQMAIWQGQLMAYYYGDSGDNCGLFVGTGTNAENFEDYSLGSKVVQGTGAEQLSWTAPIDAGPSFNSETKKWTESFYRDFTNNSGNAIVVGETGLYSCIDCGKSYGVFMIERNVLASPVAVADGQTLRVTYTTEITFPA